MSQSANLHGAAERSRGFSLAELVAALALVNLLAALLFPVFAQAGERARQATCQSNQRQIGVAMYEYMQDSDAQVVPRKLMDATGEVADSDWTQLLQPYLHSQAVFQCPSNPRHGDRFCCQSSGYVSYAGNEAGVFLSVGPTATPLAYASVRTPAQVIAVVESTARYSNYSVDDNTIMDQDYRGKPAIDDSGCLFAGHSGGSDYLFLDGHVKAYRPLDTLDRVDGGAGAVNLWRVDNASFIAASGEPIPTRPYLTLSACSKLWP